MGTLCEAAGDGLVVVDEAYGEFRRAGTSSALELLPRHRNLVVTRTMSELRREGIVEKIDAGILIKDVLALNEIVRESRSGELARVRA